MKPAIVPICVQCKHCVDKDTTYPLCSRSLNEEYERDFRVFGSSKARKYRFCTTERMGGPDEATLLGLCGEQGQYFEPMEQGVNPEKI